MSCVVRFFIPSLLVGCSLTILLLPTYIELRNSVKMDSNSYSDFYFYVYNIFELFGMNVVGANHFDYILNYENFYIYCGILIVPLVFLYFLNSSISKREKVLSMFVLLIFLFSFSFNYINYIWHGFSAPVCFNGRYTFLFILFILYLSCHSFLALESIRSLQIWLLAPIYPILSVFVLIFHAGYGDIWNVYVSVGLYLFYLLLLYIGKYEKKIHVLMFFLVLAELLFNFYVSLYQHEFIKKEVLTDFNHVMNDMVLDIQQDRDFYRVASNATFTQLDSMYYNYYGVDAFLSSLNTNVLHFFNNIGNAVRTNSYVYSTNTPFIDSLLGVRYRIYKNQENLYYDEVGRYPMSLYGGILHNKVMVDAIVYKNIYSLPIAYMVPDSILDFKNRVLSSSDLGKLKYQNILFQCLTGSDEDVLHMLSLNEVDSLHYQIPVLDKNPIYMVLDNISYQGEPFEVSVYIDDVLYSIYDASWLSMIELPSTYEVGDLIDVRIQINNDFVASMVQLRAATFDYDVFKRYMSVLQSDSLDILSFHDDSFSGKIDVKEDKTILFTTIPYEEGWHVFVDGEEVPYYEMIETFIGFGLDSGEHTVEFRFIPPGWELGFIISIISICLFALYMGFYVKIFGESFDGCNNLDFLKSTFIS